jgi:hypothetical protein
MEFRVADAGASGDAPGFRFRSWQAGTVDNLPGLDRAFGLDFSETPITDAGLQELAKHSGLHVLNLSNTKVTHAGLKQLAGLKSLRSLCLSRTQVTGLGMK